MYDAISGNKKSPTDQGPLSGILRKLGYTEDQVSSAPFFPRISLIRACVGLQILDLELRLQSPLWFTESRYGLSRFIYFACFASHIPPI